ncbi:MAG: alpha-glucan family phosphorylase [Mariprofundaceae bacterium]
MNKGQTYYLQVRPIIPKALSRLEEVAGDLWFAWNAKARALFRQMDSSLWTLAGHNPRLFLRRVSQSRLDEMVTDRAFLSLYNGVMADYDSYKAQEHQWFGFRHKDAKDYSFAYFSAEFGLHESLPIYSGGLGILAGDHCKSASDLGLPFTAVGMLYRNGYFIQTIDAQGRQVATYHENRFEDLCVEAIKTDDGQDLIVEVEMPGSTLYIKVWQATAGHMRMILLDTDLDVDYKDHDDRNITQQLYGGGIENRIKQEIVLGIGGVRALRALGIAPSVWHANEGHAAFIVLERMRELVQDHGLKFEEALEATAASTVFTTHTPVPAGHDVFPLEMFDHYMGHYAEKLGISITQLHALGHGDFGHGSSGFNQTALATHCSSYQNGVAKLHGEVSAKMFQSMWPDITPAENPMTSVTNGVHVATWLAQEWINTFDQFLGGSWRSKLQHPEYWECIHEIPDHLFWSIHQTNKQRMLQYIHEQLTRQSDRNGESQQIVNEMTRNFDPRTLIIGFARRFATYKRAALLFQDEAKLKKLFEQSDRPVIFLFAGKAHPADEPGQALIRRVHEIARKPDFVGRILMLEGYDMTLSRYMLSGVDVWLNNPQRPMEASGTSGMKAAMNGAPNLSILDGWWPEGYTGDNGWVIGGERNIDDEEQRNREDSTSLYHVLQRDIIPRYYDRSERGYSESWVHTAKRAMITSIPTFNTDRMVAEYTDRFYIPASHRGKDLCAKNFARAKALAAWKSKIRKAWASLKLEDISNLPHYSTWNYGDMISVKVKAHLGSLSADDICVEAVLLRPSREADGGFHNSASIELEHEGDGVFCANAHPGDTGDYAYQVRIYPKHKDLAHPMSMGLMTWL